MKSKLYKISQENYETIFKYYNSINSKLTKFYEKIEKYKKSTEQYCSEIKNLFIEKKVKSDLDKYETIEIDYDLNDKEIDNKALSSKENYKKKINISPITNCIEKLNNFFGDYIQNIQLFIKDFETPLKGLEDFIDTFRKEINSIQKDHAIRQKNYISKYEDFLVLNNNLKNIFSDTEEMLIKYYLDKKESLNKNNELETDNKLNLLINENIQKEEEILEKFKSLGDFGNIYNDAINEQINSIKYLSSSLFEHFEIFSNNIYRSFTKTFMEPMGQYLQPEEEISDTNTKESEKKKELDKILDSYTRKIEKKYIQSKLDEYKIQIIEKKNNKTELFENENTLKEQSSEIKNNMNKALLTEEEIFYIAKNMFEKFKLINKNNYDLKIEEKKLELKKIINKLIAFGATKKNNLKIGSSNSNKEIPKLTMKENKNIINKKEKEKIVITKEEVDYLCGYMKDKVYQRYFLIKINNFRTLGNLETPKEIFVYLTQIFSEIANNLIEEKNDIKEFLVNIEIAKLVIILSQTFYCVEDGKKKYIQKEIAKIKVFHLIEFWTQLLKYSIEYEFKNVTEVYLKIANKDDEKSIRERKNKIAFGKILPNLGAMRGFGLNEEEITKIILPFFDDYEISDENKQVILGVIQSN